MKVSELQGRNLDFAVALADGWILCGENDHVKPKHRPSLDFPGEMIKDWNAKGPHARIEHPDGRKVYFCGCDGDELPQYSEDWSIGGPIIDAMTKKFDMVLGETYCEWGKFEMDGANPLEAALRCYVALEFGEEVELPLQADDGGKR